MADVIPLKFVKTGTSVTALAELEPGETIGSEYLPPAPSAFRKVAAFSFGDASPAPIFTAPANCTDVLARVVIDTPFDGAGASLKLGTSVAPEALMAAAQNNPAQVAGYEAAPDVALTSGEAIVLTITPGTGATQGAGRVIFDAIPA